MTYIRPRHEPWPHGPNVPDRPDPDLFAPQPFYAVPAEHYADDLEALLEQVMGEDFNVQLDDGSAILVSKQLVRRKLLCVLPSPSALNGR